MRRIKNNSLTRTLALALAVTGAAVLATSCQDDTLASSGGSSNGPDADGTLRVVSVTLDGRELGTTTGAGAGSRAVYDTYVYDGENSAWTNSAGLVDGDYGKQCDNNQYNRIIKDFSNGDAMVVEYCLKSDVNDKTILPAYLLKTANGWEFRTNDATNIGEALAISPNDKDGENWGNFLVRAYIYSTAKIINTSEAPYYFTTKCVMHADNLGVGGYSPNYNYGYAYSSEWASKYSSKYSSNPYTDEQAGRLPSKDLVVAYPGSYHVGIDDEDRGALTINLVHYRRALLTLEDADLTIAGWPEGYDAIATLRADQNNSDDEDVNDESGDDYYDDRPVFSRVSEDAAGTKLRWQAITLAKPLMTGNYGDDTYESYGFYDNDKSCTLRRLHVRLCKKEDAPDPKDPSKADKSKWSEEFIITLGGTDGIEMRENHRYPLSLTLTPTHQSAATLAAFPTWAGNEEEMTSDDYSVSADADGKTTWSIYTAKGLATFRDAVNATDGSGVSLNANLCSDIDLSTVCGASLNGGTSWVPIGNSNHQYAGTFNGQHHKIKNLYINNSDNSGQGLFGAITSGATVQNIKLENANVTANNMVGALIGNIYNGTGTGTIIVSGNTVTSATVTATTSNAGGLIGYMDGGTASENTVNGTTTVTASTNNAGGLIGYMSSGTASENTVTSATVKAMEYNAGGLIGYMSSGTASENTVTSAIVTAMKSEAGGLIGFMNYGTTATQNKVLGTTQVILTSITNTAAGTLAGYVKGSTGYTTTLTDNTVAPAVTVKKDDTTAIASNGNFVGTQNGGGTTITISGNTVETE